MYVIAMSVCQGLLARRKERNGFYWAIVLFFISIIVFWIPISYSAFISDYTFLSSANTRTYVEAHAVILPSLYILAIVLSNIPVLILFFSRTFKRCKRCNVKIDLTHKICTNCKEVDNNFKHPNIGLFVFSFIIINLGFLARYFNIF